MSKRKKRNKQARPPQQETQQEQQAEPQQKDDRVKVREWVLLLTALAQLATAIISLLR